VSPDPYTFADRPTLGVDGAAVDYAPETRISEAVLDDVADTFEQLVRTAGNGRIGLNRKRSKQIIEGQLHIGGIGADQRRH